MLTLGVDAKRAFYNNRGLGSFTRTLIEGLIFHSEMFSKVKLFVPYQSNEHYCPQKILNSENVKCIYPQINNKLYGSFWRSFFLENSLKKEGVNIFHGTSNELPLLDNKCRYILTVHDLLFLKHKKNYNFIDRMIYYQKLKYSIEKAKVIHSISQHTKKDLVKFFPGAEGKVRVVYQAVNPIFSKENINKVIIKNSFINNLPVKYFLSVGALETNKNLYMALKSFVKIAEKIEEHFVFVGKDYGEKNKLMSYAIDNKIEHKVHFFDYLELNELLYLYSNATSLIILSHDEGAGLPLIEAQLMGVNVIASDIFVFNEFKSDITFFVDQKSINSIKNTMLQVASLDKNDFNYKNYEIVKKNFSLKQYIRNMEELYNEALS